MNMPIMILIHHLILIFNIMKICDALTIKLHRSAASYPIMNVQIQSNLKLPVWPVYGGVVAQLADWFSQPSITELILNNIGGRVVPMFLSSLELSPFLLLVHHTHSFTKYDPIRPLTNLIVPEGFPAHPHSGFSTVTYCLKGGLRHRDSEGIKMSYGNGDVQWMRAGRGTIHEEMWDVKDSNFFEQIEIFQLWVNLPSNKKGFPPKVTHIRSSEIPEYRTEDGVLIRVIGGTLISNDAEYQSPGNRITESPLSILDLSLPPHKKCIFQVPSGASVCLYIRRGSCVNINASDKSIIDVKLCNLMTFTASEISSPESNVVIEAGSTGLEALFLVGQKLNEPVITNGPLVQADERMMESSARSFNALGPGSFWDYKLSDDEWMNHIQKLNLQGLILATRPELS